MISALYVVLGALLIMKFTLDVVRFRRFYRVQDPLSLTQDLLYHQDLHRSHSEDLS